MGQRCPLRRQPRNHMQPQRVLPRHRHPLLAAGPAASPARCSSAASCTSCDAIATLSVAVRMLRLHCRAATARVAATPIAAPAAARIGAASESAAAAVRRDGPRWAHVLTLCDRYRMLPANVGSRPMRRRHLCGHLGPGRGA